MSRAPDPSRFDHVVVLGRLLGMPLPGTVAAAAASTQITQIPPRLSEDNARNAFGSALMALSCAADLLVLNGRVSGDESGALTYHGRNGRGS